MKALTWQGKHDVRYDTVPDPKIEDGRDAIIKVTACAICGSDLHIYDGLIPEMKDGDVLGHETMGEVVEVGRDNKKLEVGDRVVVPFTIACGECFFCQRGYFSACERSNPNRETAEKLWGHSPAGLFGYSHLLGGFPGGQAEYLRVPYADVGPIKVPSGLTDEQVLFLSDIMPTAFEVAVLNGQIRPGDSVAIVGAGPIGLAVVKTARCITRLYDFGEIRERVHVRIHRYPGHPIVDTLGLKIKHVDSAGGDVIQVIEPVRPFWMRVGATSEVTSRTNDPG